MADPQVQASQVSDLASRLQKWVTANIWKHTTASDLGKCQKLVLKHLLVTGKPDSIVHTIKLDSNDHSEPSAPLAIASALAGAAVDDACGMGTGIQRYCLYAYFESEPGNVGARHPFMVAGLDPNEGELQDSEPANEKGLIAMLMRHNEINSKNSMVAMGFMFQSQQRQIARQAEQNEKLMQTHYDMTFAMDDLVSQKHERDIRTKETEATIAMKRSIGTKLETLLPVVANRVAGRDIFPEAISPSTMLLSTLVESMTPDQVQVLKQTMTPEQTVLFVDIIANMQKAKLNDDRASKGLSLLVKDKVQDKAQKMVEERLGKGAVTLKAKLPIRNQPAASHAQPPAAETKKEEQPPVTIEEKTPASSPPPEEKSENPTNAESETKGSEPNVDEK